MKMYFRHNIVQALLAAALLGGARAALADELSISTSCQDAAASLLQQPFGECASVLALASVFATSGSILQPLNQWLDNSCSRSCGESEIRQAKQTFDTGCSSDLARQDPLAGAFSVLIGNYTQFTKFSCLEETASSSYCVISLLQSVEVAQDPFTLRNFSSLTSGGPAAFASFLTGIPTSLICTDCVHGLVTELKPILGTGAFSLAGTALNNTCGAGFVDGRVPDTLKEAQAQPSTTATGTSQSDTGNDTPTSAAERRHTWRGAAGALALSLAFWTVLA